MQPFRLVCLPMGWSLSSFHFCQLTETIVRHPTGALLPARASLGYRRQMGWKSPDDTTIEATLLV
jgi:hypothetical protein